MCILNRYENIYIYKRIEKKDSRSRGHEVTLPHDQCGLDIKKYSFSMDNG